MRQKIQKINVFQKIIKKIVSILIYETYLLQFQDYSTDRFFADIRFFLKNKLKVVTGKKIEWTSKAKIIFFSSIFFQLVFSFLIVHTFNLSIIFPIIALLVLFFALSPVFFVFLIFSTIIFFPFDFIFKKIVILRAKNKIKKYRKNIKVIAITGSYGKTTMKDAISFVLSKKFNILKTEGNKNTILGISQLINKKLDESVEIFIVEMAAYKIGDIKELCDLVLQPDMSILTGINESHLERFKKIENTINAKFEIIQNCKKNGTVVLNADNELVVQNFREYLKDQKIYFYSSKNNPLSNYRFKDKIFYEDGSGIYFEINDEFENLGQIKTPFLSNYIIGIVMSCMIVGKEFGMSFVEIKEKVENLQQPEHRLQAIKAKNNILIIDDSYNGNPDGVREAIDALSLFVKRRKIYVTPGLAEVGEKNRELHLEIGKKLAGVADMVILEKNEACKFIKEGLLQNNFLEKYIKEYDSIFEAHIDLDNILLGGDVVLFQRGRNEFLFKWIRSMVN
ncbi:MAG: UDP-N-acetylmuramoyl-tripeptide--D-alanyl-D-alanine ligase MurF [Parcubacteria group bacterium Athens0714_16]|nr:MAG: UDP-N-acetylmuramoyl-tripeptide--D-alanyl-D-alanine ligase MurF [Parcubacteria group bacterium Athens0714_16]